ncbi:MAG: pilus assembly protein [Rhodobacteraceae bacterium]|nr:MAG: pilus assembly protein [Paracoccaceae bacterium]
MFLIALKGFFYSESGAVSVDFVVLTSLVLSFGITVATLVAAGVNPIASGISAVMTPTSEFTAKFVSVDE